MFYELEKLFSLSIVMRERERKKIGRERGGGERQLRGMLERVLLCVCHL